MTIEEIRNCFDKAHILISGNGILLLYLCRNGEISQCVDHSLLYELIHNSESVRVECDGNSSIKITFAMKTNTTDDIIFISTKQEPTLEEIKNMCFQRDGYGAEFKEYLLDLSQDSSEKQLFDKFAEFLNDKREFEPDVDSSSNDWEWLLDCVMRLVNETDVEFEILYPEEKYAGSITIYAMKPAKGNFIISGNLKTIVEEIVRSSSFVDFEGNSEEKAFDVTFYA